MCSTKCASPRWSSSSSTEPALTTSRSSARPRGCRVRPHEVLQAVGKPAVADLRIDGDDLGQRVLRRRAGCRRRLGNGHAGRSATAVSVRSRQRVRVDMWPWVRKRIGTTDADTAHGHRLRCRLWPPLTSAAHWRAALDPGAPAEPGPRRAWCALKAGRLTRPISGRRVGSIGRRGRGNLLLRTWARRLPSRADEARLRGGGARWQRLRHDSRPPSDGPTES